MLSQEAENVRVTASAHKSDNEDKFQKSVKYKSSHQRGVQRAMWDEDGCAADEGRERARDFAPSRTAFGSKISLCGLWLRIHFALTSAFSAELLPANKLKIIKIRRYDVAKVLTVCMMMVDVLVSDDIYHGEAVRGKEQRCNN